MSSSTLLLTPSSGRLVPSVGPPGAGWRNATPPRSSGGIPGGLGLGLGREDVGPVPTFSLVDGECLVAGVAELVEGVLARRTLEARGGVDGLDDVGPGRLDALGVGQHLGHGLDQDVGGVVGLTTVGAERLLEPGRLVVADELLGALEL